MRKRQQAPGELELVRAFVNTLDLEKGTEALDSPAAAEAWLSAHRLAPGGIGVTASQLQRALELREALRSILVAHSEGGPEPAGAWKALDDAAARARLRVRFDPRGAALVEPAVGGIDGALGRLLAIVHSAVSDGSWRRLKACRLDTCEWAFYDHTKNHSGAWCEMEVCGNRAKARTYRQRHAGVVA
jgi:predicted RNA-binding Zn ribbon-like protein